MSVIFQALLYSALSGLLIERGVLHNNSTLVASGAVFGLAALFMGLILLICLNDGEVSS